MHRDRMAVNQIERPSFTKPNGNGISDPAEVLYESVLPPPTAWQRLFKWEKNLIVAGKTIEKGLVLTPTMGLTIILALASIGGTMYYRMSDQIKAKDEAYQQQRDMLIEIKTELKIQKEHELEYRQEQRQINGETQAWQQVTNKDIAQLKERRR